MLITEEDIADPRRKFAINGKLPYHIASTRGRTFDFSIPEGSFGWVEGHYGSLRAPWYRGCAPCDLLEIVVLLAFMKRVPKLPAGRQWFALRHQADGLSCGQYYFIATQIVVKASLYSTLRQVARDRYPGGQAGWDGSHFSSSERFPDDELLLDYRSQIAERGLEYSGKWLVESIYPLDASPQNLDILSEDPLTMADLGISTNTDVEDTGAMFLIVTANSD